MSERIVCIGVGEYVKSPQMNNAIHRVVDETNKAGATELQVEMEDGLATKICGPQSDFIVLEEVLNKVGSDNRRISDHLLGIGRKITLKL